MRYLGVDPGGRRMGIAVGDDLTAIALPVEVLQVRSKAHAVELICDALALHGAATVVLGFPTREDGSPTPACARSEAIAEALSGRGITVLRQSEYLSSNEARRRAREAGVPATKPIDHYAAQIVLEEFLASQRTGRRP